MRPDAVRRRHRNVRLDAAVRADTARPYHDQRQSLRNSHERRLHGLLLRLHAGEDVDADRTGQGDALRGRDTGLRSAGGQGAGRVPIRRADDGALLVLGRLAAHAHWRNNQDQEHGYASVSTHIHGHDRGLPVARLRLDNKQCLHHIPKRSCLYAFAGPVVAVRDIPVEAGRERHRDRQKERLRRVGNLSHFSTFKVFRLPLIHLLRLIVEYIICLCVCVLRYIVFLETIKVIFLHVKRNVTQKMLLLNYMKRSIYLHVHIFLM